MTVPHPLLYKLFDSSVSHPWSELSSATSYAVVTLGELLSLWPGFLSVRWLFRLPSQVASA